MPRNTAEISEAEQAVKFKAYKSDREAAARFLNKYSIEGGSVFGSSPRDATDVLLRQISGLTRVMEQAYNDADQVQREGNTGDSGLGSIYSVFVGRAWEAVGSLTALALFFHEAQ